MEDAEASGIDGSTADRYPERVQPSRVVIVGGGVIGCATAAELARVGIDVIVMERAELAAGASGRNHGLMFAPQDPLLEDLYRTSQDLYRNLADKSDVNIALDDEPRGMLVVVAADDEWAIAEAETLAYEAAGIKVDRLDREELLKEEPNLAPHHLGGFLINDGYILDPAALTVALAYEARDAGAQIQTHTDVKQVLLRDNKVRGVVTDDGVVDADCVVDAAGPWAPKLARSVGADLPITGARGWLLLTRAVDTVANHLIESAGWRPLAGDAGPDVTTVAEYGRGDTRENALGLIIQQNRTGHALLGGSRIGSTREDPEGVEVTIEIARRAAETLPALRDVPIAAVWSGVRPVTADGRPLIGWLEGLEGFFVAGGHAGMGVMLAGGTGRLVAQMITGDKPFTDPGPFDPTR